MLDKSWYGKVFIRVYYFVSPFLVKIFGKSTMFRVLFTKPLNKMVDALKKQGFKDTPYYD